VVDVSCIAAFLCEPTPSRLGIFGPSADHVPNLGEVVGVTQRKPSKTFCDRSEDDDFWRLLDWVYDPGIALVEVVLSKARHTHATLRQSMSNARLFVAKLESIG
jgi:hypothetical protein